MSSVMRWRRLVMMGSLCEWGCAASSASMLSQGSIGMKIDRNQADETTSLGSEPNSSSYRNTAQRFSPKQVNPRAVRRFLDGSGPVTANWFYKYQTLATFYRYAQAHHYVQNSPLPRSKPQ